MKFGKDFFKMIAFIVRLLRMLAESFGDEDEQEEAKNNHIEV